MPLKRCEENGKPGYKWGETGTCHTYDSGDRERRLNAKEKALMDAENSVEKKEGSAKKMDINKSKTIKFVKADDEHRTATFVALEPNEEDKNGDIVTKSEIIKTSQEFMKNLSEKNVNFNHEKDTDTEEAKFVENFVLSQDTEMGGLEFKKGTWFVGIQFSENLFQKLKQGEINGISVEGTAERVEN